MSNPFKGGDKVVENMWPKRDLHKIGVATVLSVEGQWVYVDVPSSHEYHKGADRWYYSNLRAAIAGRDYQLCTPAGDPPVANSGHLADGSGVQKHSAGPIYPCVIVLRDKKLKGTTSFDYGLTSPRNNTPIWFSNLEAAHAVADLINKDIAP